MANDIKWYPIEELKITPEMENLSLLLYVEQEKLCARHFPEVVTADIIDGKILVSGGYYFRQVNDLENSNWYIDGLSHVTHYAYLNDPWEEEE